MSITQAKILFTLLCSLLLMPASTLADSQLLDRIIVIVDDDVVTASELRERMELTRLELQSGNRTVPPDDVLRERVLEILISDSVLRQQASQRGIRISDSRLNQAMQTLARDNGMSLTQFRQTMVSQGIDYRQYRESLRNEIALSSLRRQYTQNNARVSEAEIDEFIRLAGDDLDSYEYRLSHILVPLPEAASSDQIERGEAQVDAILQRLDQGEPFAQVASIESSADTALSGGDLGWRKRAEIPGIFTEAVLSMAVGEFRGPIRSASGFHIVYVEDRRDSETVLKQQTRSRHILIRPNELVSDEEARQRLQEIRQRLLQGEDFARLARLYSVDYGSGSNGGDLGWMTTDQLVPEYARVMNRSDLNTVSEPFRSQFGWHILEVTERRTVDETLQSKREAIREQLLREKQREVFDLWKRELRDQAFIVYPDA